ncbi:MAG: hypothetical protein HYY20_08605, partial [Candidatus Tectomicrobia bacterium]|nr:hypothetical protein [Candidatus Tectomicrobia bacterium]
GGAHWGEIFPHPDPERPETWEAWFQEMETMGGGRIFREARVRCCGRILAERQFDNEAARRYASGHLPQAPMALPVVGSLYLRLVSFFLRRLGGSLPEQESWPREEISTPK